MPIVIHRDDDDPDESWRQLTPRETEVLALVSRGKTNKEIAAALFVGLNTAKFHVVNILRKKRMRTRFDLFEHVQKFDSEEELRRWFTD